MEKLTENTIISFGKHAGKKLKEIPDGWFIWMYDHKRLTGSLKTYAEETVTILKIQTRQQKKDKE